MSYRVADNTECPLPSAASVTHQTSPHRGSFHAMRTNKIIFLDDPGERQDVLPVRAQVSTSRLFTSLPNHTHPIRRPLNCQAIARRGNGKLVGTNE